MTANLPCAYENETAMAKLTIPTSEIPTLRKLSELPDEVFAKLLKSLQEIDVKLLQVTNAEAMQRRVPEVKTSDWSSFLKTIYALYTTKLVRKLTPKEIAEDITETLSTEKPEFFAGDSAAKIQKRLEDILSINAALTLTAKAQDVMTEQPRIFVGARIMSDIRPVFESSTDSISAAMVIHQFDIHFMEDGEHKQFYAAMNTEDIRKLKLTIERAERKAETLQSFIRKSNIPYFEDRSL